MQGGRNDRHEMLRDGPIPALVEVNEIGEIRIGRLIEYVRAVVDAACRSVRHRVAIHLHRKNVEAAINAAEGALYRRFRYGNGLAQVYHRLQSQIAAKRRYTAVIVRCDNAAAQ